MSVAILRGSQVHPGAAYSEISMTLSTATAAQTIDASHDVINLGMGTEAATGQQNTYLLATDDAQQGRTVFIQATATGRANLDVGGGTATDKWVFLTATDVMIFQQRDAGWSLVHNAGATLATTG